MLVTLAFCSPALPSDAQTRNPVETKGQPPAGAVTESAPASDSAQKSASIPKPAVPEGEAAAKSARAAPNASQAGDNEIVCKKIQVTGSRVRKEKVCKSQREWREIAAAARAMMKRNDRKSSTQPGGESLIPGG